MILKIKYIIDNRQWVEFKSGSWSFHWLGFYSGEERTTTFEKEEYNYLCNELKKVEEVEVHEFKKKTLRRSASL